MDKHIPALLTIITALLYVLGLVYYESFLTVYGLDKSQFPLSFDLVLFKGFVSTVKLGITSLGYFYLSAIGVVLVAITGRFILKAIKEHRILPSLRKKTQELFKQEKEESQKKEFIDFAFNVFELVSGLILISLLLLLVIILSEKSGKESALKFHEKCELGSISKSNIITHDNSNSFSGCTIVCSSSQCAYLGGSKILIINNNGTIHSEIRHNK